MRNMAAYGTEKKDFELDCLLFFPPVGFQFIAPEIGLPQLAAYLNAHKIKVKAYDLNYFFIDRFIPRYKELISTTIEGSFKEHGDAPLLRVIGKRDFIQLNLAKRFGSFSNFIRDESFFLMDELVSIAGKIYDVRKIIRMIEKVDSRVFDLFFKVYLSELIKKSGIIGFSVLDAHQLTSVLYFAKSIKKIDRNKIIIIGGPWCICSRKNLKYFKGIFNFIDFVVTTEGEIPLRRLIKYFKDVGRAHSPDSIGGLTFLKNNNVVDTGDSEVADLNTLPVCNYDNFGLTGYCSGHLPVMTTKGCYWGRCKFCHHSQRTDIVRSKSVERIVGEIECLKKRYKVKEIDFADSSTPVDLLIGVAKKIISRKIDVKWNCLLRAEARITFEDLELLKRSGCTGVAVGLECTSQESLDKMGKGIDLKVLDRLLDKFLRADLKIQLFIMNYPGQTKREYTETWNYILSRREKIADVVPQDFHFGRNTYLFSHCREFNIKQPRDNKYDIRSFSLPYECKTGMSKKDFFNITVSFSRRFYEMRDNYKITRRVFRKKKKNYLLVRPPTLQAYNAFDPTLYNHRYSEPVSLLKIGSFLKDEGHSVEFIDCLEGALPGNIDPKRSKKSISFFKTVKCGNFEKEKITKDLYRRGMGKREFIERISKVKKPDEIYITSQFTYEYDFIKEIVTICRERFPEATVSLGGIFASLCPDKARELQCDIFAGLFHSVDYRDTDLGLLNYKTKSAVIKFSRGCQNSCKYCSVPYLEGRKTYFRPIDMVISEMLAKYRKFNIRKFIFWESNAFGVKNNYLETLLGKIIELKLDIELRFPEGLQPNFISK